jgi:16S rRNA (cytosine967-C5)-methyltransferase
VYTGESGDNIAAATNSYAVLAIETSRNNNKLSQFVTERFKRRNDSDDREDQINLRDIRPQILGNLRLRIKRYGFQIQESIELDLTEKIPTKMNEQFDQIICDVPCSGSGTWSHSPEQFYFFDAKQLKNYVQRQALILRHVWKALKPGGKLIYLTCSILSAENEMQIAQFRQEYECELEQQKVLFHQPYGGDGMYIAVLRKPDQEVLI